MEKVSQFITTYSSWFPAVFLAAGFSLAILAFVLFLRFHLAGVIKTWLFHHGMWKGGKSHETRHMNTAGAEEYQKEISGLFATSGTGSGKLKHETSTQNFKSAETGPAPVFTESKETTILISNQEDTFKKQESQNAECSDNTDGSEATTLLENNENPEHSGEPQTMPDSDQPISLGNVTVDSDTNMDGGEPTVLLKKEIDPDGSDPTTVLKKNRNEADPEENRQSSATRPIQQGEPTKHPDDTDPDFKITRKEILIHTDEKI